MSSLLFSPLISYWYIDLYYKVASAQVKYSHKWSLLCLPLTPLLFSHMMTRVQCLTITSVSCHDRIKYHLSLLMAPPNWQTTPLQPSYGHSLSMKKSGSGSLSSLILLNCTTDSARWRRAINAGSTILRYVFLVFLFILLWFLRTALGPVPPACDALPEAPPARAAVSTKWRLVLL